ncbi:uncharacterized protein LOC113146251 isoform X2 [Mastacembelus armatus]|uniref:uncharacterized protein LOC113146251 isoform X2 n=1 Tax=Mastacembelus armatus TaxID=205130 RepID=UPI000E463F99|nr:fas apoptotic inhibitory molecule 3 isoform X2 [Mastacembelus armatus]
MNLHLFLFFCCITALKAEMMFTKNEGEDLKISFSIARKEGDRMYLCRNTCKKEDILIETNGNRVQSGRYTIRYDSDLYVTITELTKTDMGRYRCGVSNGSSSDSSQDFELRVRELCEGEVTSGKPRVYNSIEGGSVTVTCSLSAAEQNKKFLCKEQCNKVLIETNSKAKSDRYSIDYGSRRFFNVTITQLTKSDSGRYRCGVGRQMSQNTCEEFEITLTNSYTLPLVVSLVVTGLLATFLLLLYKWKIRTSSNCCSL